MNHSWICTFICIETFAFHKSFRMAGEFFFPRTRNQITIYICLHYCFIPALHPFFHVMAWEPMLFK
ncbi:hypothetical protein K450DRAFT_245720 [Umbelopsis ramanniana AG]|uniref:Uncharacterized protein n=1 Tax=Umbelopsis ramanniana AG TaxID=1314678 RepID=A0AAD5E839_UMBRA|nr:uncharacterized protein K450DRAFT_245720 [Umbelopsis ramanniana AG]KAI8578619.1 hypothetical protein K450DRAFT_245720 [Umbelopsis ramanniana AG]